MGIILLLVVLAGIIKLSMMLHKKLNERYSVKVESSDLSNDELGSRLQFESPSYSLNSDRPLGVTNNVPPSLAKRVPNSKLSNSKSRGNLPSGSQLKLNISSESLDSLARNQKKPSGLRNEHV
eukprot:NODE_148_length_15570_cov_0.950100.p10 type:complete len:123 gc:universal NODE_148_length_15570_cov_0.950100:9608-9976(+)